MDGYRTLMQQELSFSDQRIPISMKVNDRVIDLFIKPTERLVDILREQLKLTGTKISCGIGRCGACSIMMDGKLVNSCLVMGFQANHTSIVTIEGLGDLEMHPIQKAFLEEGGYQCGYCTPGMVMAVKALIDETPNPNEEEIQEALSGNLCRCTGYGGIIRSVQRIACERRESNK